MACGTEVWQIQKGPLEMKNKFHRDILLMEDSNFLSPCELSLLSCLPWLWNPYSNDSYVVAQNINQDWWQEGG